MLPAYGGQIIRLHFAAFGHIPAKAPRLPGHVPALHWQSWRDARCEE
jgi:hypothetical protein